jgi:hypothetical protein
LEILHYAQRAVCRTGRLGTNKATRHSLDGSDVVFFDYSKSLTSPHSAAENHGVKQ